MVHRLRQLAAIPTCGTPAELRPGINWCLSLPPARGSVKSRHVRKRLSSASQAFFGKGWPQPINSACWNCQRQNGFCGERQRGPVSPASLHTFPICQLSSLPERCLMLLVRVPASQLTAAGDNGRPRCNGGVKPKQQKKTNLYPKKQFIHVTLLPLEGLQRGEAQIQQTYRQHTFTQREYKRHKTPFTAFCANSAVR